ncbi:MAG: TonB-dependent receptor [Caulobacterales bacterium]|nr:TonB-dependent receptor [Caulobacterales bacterium]
MASSVAIAALAAGSQAFAQEAASVEEGVVTGSSIRGVAPVGSALIGVTRDTIQAVAPTNTKDLLATVPALGNFGTNAEQSTPNRFRTSGYLANIHNLGIYATLTLVNGHRIAATGTEGTYPDPSNVPTIAIQRTEIIADGASAIYGSDATAGVVNFIYRKPFDGIEAQATYSFDGETRYEKKNFGVIGGKTWDGGGLMVAYEYSSNLSPLTSEIDFLALNGNQTSRGGRDLRNVTGCVTPVMRAVQANGVPVGATYGSSASGFSTNQANFRCPTRLVPSTIISDGERNTFLATIDHQLTDNVKIWGELSYGHIENESIGQRQSFSVLMPNTNPYFTAANVPPALLGQDRISIARSGNGLFGDTYKGGATGTLTTLVTGLDIDLGADWKGQVSLDISRTRDTNGRPGSELDTRNLIAALADTNAATALNPFGTAAQNNPATLAKIDNGSGQLNWGQQGLQELQFKADGPVMELPGGTLRAAVGTSFRATQSNQLQLGGSRNPNAGFDGVVRDDHPRQQVSAAFFELNAPLVGAANELPFVKELTLSVSGRYDYYDKYEGTFNPKYGIVYSPFEDLKFHASYGTNFNAPNVGLLGSLFGQPQYNTNPNNVIGYGPYKGTTLTNINQYTLSGQGGGNLTPEEAKTKSFGFEYNPGFLPGLRASVNWYKVDYSNLFFKITGADLITNPAFAAYAEFYPTPERMAEIIAQYPPSSPITVSTFEYIPHTEAVNLGTRIYEGIDYDISYRFNTDSFGTFQAGFTANQQLKLDQQILAGSAFQDRLGTQDAPKWKTRVNFGWNLNNLTAAVFYNYQGSYTNTASVIVPQQKVEAFKTVDATLSYEFPNVGLGFVKGVTLQGRVVNLFDKDPPFFDNADGYNGTYASPYPRSYDLTLRAKF